MAHPGIAFRLRLGLCAGLCAALLLPGSALAGEGAGKAAKTTKKSAATGAKPKLPRRIRSARDGATLLLVPAGPFWMGSDTGRDNEKPRHRVTLPAFYIDREEVCTARYLRCVKAGACKAPAWDRPGNKYHLKTGRKKDFHGYTGAQQPVVGVSWHDAVAYCRWAGRRLPSEAEWEKAARGDDGRTYPWGEAKPSCARATFDRGGERPCRGATARVGAGARGKSPHGALNMAGNVWEWVADRYDAAYYGASPATNPRGPAKGHERVKRGGSWHTVAAGLRTSYRTCAWPGWLSRELGFRCARDATPAAKSP